MGERENVTLASGGQKPSTCQHDPSGSINIVPSSASPRDQLFDGAHIAASNPGPGGSARIAGQGPHTPTGHAQAMSSTPQRPHINGFSRALNGVNGSAVRRAASMTRDGSFGLGVGAASVAEEEEEREDDHTHSLLKSRWVEIESSVDALFGGQGTVDGARQVASAAPAAMAAEEVAKTAPPPKKVARQIDDDYGDDDEDEDEEDIEKESPLKSKGKPALSNGLSSHGMRSPAPAVKPPLLARTTTTIATEQAKSSEDVRKQLEQDKKDAAEGAKRNFQTMFYTFENDRDAMLEQQKLDELDREVDNEISADPNDTSNPPTSAAVTAVTTTQGSLGSADLGASSLTLKHLIARIDAKRDMVKASDNQLRSLISEVRKGRSKWASEDRVGQEELYEAAEKVLMELKAMTEFVQPFLQRVSKREAPDYFNVIKQPMDIGSMLKKLKQLAYKSKKDFVDDLNLIWQNCLTYNRDANHPLRKKANHMIRETDKLIPLIPEIVVRDRAEVEAEERRLHSLEVDDSDDDDAPIMASRGRKAPKKGAKGAPSSSRKAPPAPANEQATPAPDTKPTMPSAASHLHNNFLRADSEIHDASSAGFATPPPGLATPIVNGVHSAAHGSQVDAVDVDNLGQSVLGVHTEDADEYDPEFTTWKQVTMKDRATAAAERNRLFRGEHLNLDEPALLRSKAMMRRWIRQQKFAISAKSSMEADAQEAAEAAEPSGNLETLAEGIEKDEDSTLPDYYTPLSAIPDLNERWKWTTDSEGHALPQSEEFMRIFPKGRYLSYQGSLNRRLESNLRQMQETRKVCAKIGIVKQMQIQTQTYQNQFQKYEPDPFVEQDVEAAVVCEEGPLMAPWVNRAAFQRSVGKIFYHAGFEDFQPSAIDVATDVASDFMAKVAHTLKMYHEQPRRDAETPRFTFEEKVLHVLDENGMDIESLESYVRDDVERLSTKLGVVHERMKSHLADLLRPALGDHAGQDGVGAFNDGSEQFVGGDFAEDIDEDFFGFRELGLADELGLESLSVPLHLLQNRMHSAYQAQNQGPVTTTGLVFELPEPYEPLTTDNISQQVGLVQDFFRNRLRANRELPLIDDEDLPQKQRFPKPRLPPTGKISSPRKRPLREQQQMAKKKRKLDEEARLTLKPIGKLRLTMPEQQTETEVNGIGGDPDKEDPTNGGPLSPESIVAGA